MKMDICTKVRNGLSIMWFFKIMTAINTLITLFAKYLIQVMNKMNLL